MVDGLRLFNVLTRHQIYLEGVKEGQAREFNDVLFQLNIELKNLFSRLEYETLDALTKAELRDFLSQVKASQSRIYNSYSVRIQKKIQEFMSVEVDITKEIFETLTERPIQQAYEEGDGVPIWGIAAFLGTSKADTLLWGVIKNAPIPANGSLTLNFIKTLINSVMKSVENLITKGYANKWSKQQLLNEIIGTKRANYRDGQFQRILRQTTAVVSTVLQHISSIIQAGIASIFFRRYVWVSVLDGNTTDICIGRDGKIYEYGRGPLPPAHIRCRSITVPKPADVDDAPGTYYSFLKSQPPKVQNDILGKQTAEGLRSGNLNSKDFPKFVDASPLSIDEFSKKRGLILTEG